MTDIIRSRLHNTVICITVLVLALTMFTAVPVINKDYSYGMSKVCKTTANVYVRSKATTSSAKRGKLNKGSYFVVKSTVKGSKGTTWYKITYKSKTGYVCASYAKAITVKTTGVSGLQGKVNVSSGNVILRDGPGTIYPSVGKLAKNKTFTITGKAKDVYGTYWYQLKYNGKYCYTISKYIKTSSTKTTSMSSTSSTSSTSSSASFAVTAISGFQGKVNVSSGSLYVRKGPATTYSTLGSLAKDKTFNITGKTTDQETIWYRLNYNGANGFVCGKYVTVTSVSSTSNNTTAAKDTNDARTLKARQAAVDWAIAIANDNSFHYGEGKWAHHFGCYFCGTNQASGSAKRKAGATISECEKTYCCNPFVTAAYSHGAGAKEVDCKVSSMRIGLANDSNKVFKNTSSWLLVEKPSSVTKLKVGDILLTPTHAMLYAGDGKVVHAAHADKGVKDSTWDSSIKLGSISSNQWNRTTKIYRYLGTGKF